MDGRVGTSGRPRAAKTVACPPAGRFQARPSPLPLREGLETVLVGGLRGASAGWWPCSVAGA